jgi:hypothetical protein
MITVDNVQRKNIIRINGIEQKVDSIDANTINGLDISSNSFSAIKMDESKLYDMGFTYDEQYSRWVHEKLVGYEVYVHGRTFSFGVDLEDAFHFAFHTDEVHTFQNAFNLLTLQ